MLLKILSALGRKKTVLDRGSSHPKFNEAKPWLNRYYVLFRHRPKWFPFNIIIHEMLDDDHGEGVHNHLCPYITIIIKGGYWETTRTGKHWRAPGYIGFRSANNFHRVDLGPETKPMTIFIPGPFGLRKGARSEYGIEVLDQNMELILKLKLNERVVSPVNNHQLPLLFSKTVFKLLLQVFLEIFFIIFQTLDKILSK